MNKLYSSNANQYAYNIVEEIFSDDRLDGFVQSIAAQIELNRQFSGEPNVESLALFVTEAVGDMEGVEEDIENGMEG